MKRVLSAFLAVVMLLSAGSFLSADTTMTAGEKLYELGLIKGDENHNLMSSSPIKREDAVIVIIRMLGLEDEARRYAGTSGFSDVPEGKYYSPYIAYARAHGITNGMSEDYFGTGRYLNQKEMYAFLLKGLGYGDLAWKNIYFDAKSAGLTDSLNADKAADIAYRSDVYRVMLKSLDATVSGEGRTLREKLGLGDIILGSEVIKNITVSNKKRIDLDFKDKLRYYDVDKYHFKLTRDDGKILNYHIVSTGDKSAVILLNNRLGDGAKLTLTVQNFTDGDTYIAPRTYKIDLVDREDPELLSAEFVDSRTLKLIFTEPIRISTSSYKKSNYITTDGKNLPVMFTSDPATNTLYARYSNNLSERNHRIEIKSIPDFVNKVMSEREFDLEVMDSVDAPYVEDVKVLSAKSIVVYFDRPLLKAGSFKLDGKVVSNVAFYNDAHTAVKLDLPSKLSTVVTKGSVLEYKGQKSYSPKSVTDWERFDFTLEDDLDMPKASVEILPDGYVKFVFTKPMDAQQGFISLKKAKDNSVIESKLPAHTFRHDTGDRVIYYKFNNLLNTNKIPYKLVLKGFKDATFRANEMLEAEYDIEAIDTVKPKLVYKTGKQAVYVYQSPDGKEYDNIRLYFSEAMNADDLSNLANYSISRSGFGGLDNLSGAEVEDIAEDGKSVVIRVPNARAISNSDKFRISNLRDTSGNRMVSVNDVVKVAHSSFRLISVEAIAKDKVVFKFSDPVQAFNNYAYLIKKNQNEQQAIWDSEIDPDDHTKVMATLSGDLPSNLSGYRAVAYEDEYKQIINIYGEALLNNYTKTVYDKIRPEVKSIDVTNTYFEVSFTEGVLYDGAANKSVSNNITIIDENNQIIDSSKYTVEKVGDGSYVDKIRIVETAPFTFETGKTYRVQVVSAWDRDNNQMKMYEKAVEAE